MQPIPQASLDPKLKDIGQLRADQEFLWSDRLFRSSLTTPAFQNITQIVRILPPPRAWIGARPGICKTPVICRLARLEKRLDFRCATRNTTPQAPWALQNSKAIGQKCEKPWENQGFAAERTGTELFDVLPLFLSSLKLVPGLQAGILIRFQITYPSPSPPEIKGSSRYPPGDRCLWSLIDAMHFRPKNR